jgi:ELWxxDGT repeat protein
VITLYFVADDGVNGNELWKSDGTTANMVKDIAPPGTNLTPTHLTAYNGLLYFNANDGDSGQELWVSDGTETGTVMLKDIYPGWRLESHPPDRLQRPALFPGPG